MKTSESNISTVKLYRACHNGSCDPSNEFRLTKIPEPFKQRRTNQQCRTTSVQTDNNNNTEQISNKEDSNGHADTDEDFISSDNEETMTMLREALYHLLSLCGNKSRMWITHKYQESTRQARLYYLSCAHSITRSVLGIMVPYYVNELEHDLFKRYNDKNVIKLDGHFLSVM